MASMQTNRQRTVPPSGYRRRSSTSPAEPPPHFLAIVLEFPMPEQKLMIPQKSALRFGHELSETATLIVPNGRSWRVRLEKDTEENQKIWFHGGLQEFLDCYSVKYFYNLHFRYDGDSTFHVCIFDELGSEIDYPIDNDDVEDFDTKPPLSSHGLFVEIDEIEDVKSDISRLLERRRFRYQTRSRTRSRTGKQDRPEVKEPSSSRSRGIDTKSRPCDFVVKRENEEEAEIFVPKSFYFGGSRRIVMSKETENAVRAATTCRREKPSFLVVLRPLNTEKKFLDVPAEFAKKYLSQCSEKVRVWSRNGKRKWDVRCYDMAVHKDGWSTTVKKISKGFGQFVADNGLEEEDVCVFELIEKGARTRTSNVALRAWIYRAADFADPARKRFKEEYD